MNAVSEATAGMIPCVVLQVYGVLHEAACGIIGRGEAHDPMLVSVALNGQIQATVLDELPRSHWSETLAEVAKQRDVIVACLIAEADVAQLLPVPDAKRPTIIFSFMEGAHNQEYMAICEIDRARGSLTMGQVDPVIRDW